MNNNFSISGFLGVLFVVLLSGTSLATRSGVQTRDAKKREHSEKRENEESKDSRKKQRLDTQESVFHFRDPQGSNCELLDLKNQYNGFNPSRGSGTMGSGLYVLLQEIPYNEDLGATLLKIIPNWGDNPLVLETTEQVNHLDTLARELLRYLIVNNMEEDQLFGRPDTEGWQQYIRDDAKKQRKCVKGAFEALFLGTKANFYDVLDETETQFVQAGFAALNQDAKAFVRQPINIFLLEMGHTSVMNRALDNFKWGSVLFDFTEALRAAKVVAGPGI